MTPYTHQTAFETAAKALIAQNDFSLVDDGSTCAYRDPDGNKCAIGHLIPNELYGEVTEGLGVIEMLKQAPSIAPLFAECEDQFLTELQGVHDNLEQTAIESPEGFAIALSRFAWDWDLDASFIPALGEEIEDEPGR